MILEVDSLESFLSYDCFFSDDNGILENDNNDNIFSNNNNIK